MSVKFIAIVDNIFYAGKRYSINQTVLVDDQEAPNMNTYWWKNFSEWQKEQERIVSEKQEMTDSEKDIEIKSLKEKITIIGAELDKFKKTSESKKKTKATKKTEDNTGSKTEDASQGSEIDAK